MQTLDIPDDDPLGSHFFCVSLYTITDAFALTIGCSLNTQPQTALQDASPFSPDRRRMSPHRSRSSASEFMPFKRYQWQAGPGV